LDPLGRKVGADAHERLLDGRRVVGVDEDLPEPPTPDPLGFLEHDATVAIHAPELLAQVVTAVRIALEKDRGRQALERSQGRMRALLDAMPDPMLRFTRDGPYVDIQGDVRGLVRPRGQMIGRNV